MGAHQLASNTQIAPDSAQIGDIQQVVAALKQAISMVVDRNGFVDINKLVQVWPQVAQQMGINIPLQTIMQYIGQNPETITSLIAEMGLSGIIVDGKQMGVEQLGGGEQTTPLQTGGNIASGGASYGS